MIEIKLQETNKKDEGITWPSIILLIGAFLLLIGVLVIGGVIKFNEYEDKIESLNRVINQKNKQVLNYEAEILSYKADINEYKDKIDFFDEHVVFVLDGYGKYYYTYDQVQQVTQGKAYSFWVYSDVGAKNAGYKKWK